MGQFRTCPECGTIYVCWNWCHIPIDRAVELNPHLTREELLELNYTHECWICGNTFNTSSEVIDGITYDKMKRDLQNLDWSNFK